MCDFITQSSTLPFFEEFAKSVILCSVKWYLGAHWELWWKENVLRSKLEGSPLRNFVSMCECNSQSYTFLLSVQFDNTVFWKSAVWYLWTQWSLRWQGKYPQMKTRRSFVRNFLVIREFISQCYTYVSCSSPLPLCLRNLRRTSLDRIEAYADKGNIISSKRERSVVRNFFVICEFVSQSYNLWVRTSLLKLFSWNLQSEIWEPRGTHVGKGNTQR